MKNDTTTYGQQLVGLTFNPSGNEKVNKVNQLCAELADLLHKDIREQNQVCEFKSRFYSSAIDQILVVQMLSVKYLTQ